MEEVVDKGPNVRMNPDGSFFDVVTDLPSQKLLDRQRALAQAVGSGLGHLPANIEADLEHTASELAQRGTTNIGLQD